MECRTLEITIQYAEDLSKVSFISKMDVYVVVSISGGDESSKQKTKTEVSRGGDANPTWSTPMKLAVEEAALLQNRLMLDFKIKCERALGDRVIGEVHVPVKELLDFPAKIRGGATTASAAKTFVSYQVKKPGGKPKGKLTFSYQFLGKTATSAAPPPPPPPPRKPTVSYPAVEVTPPYPPAALGAYPPIVPPQTVMVPSPDFVIGSLYPPVYGGLIKQEWPTPPPLPPQGYFSHPPPAMQLAPDWWVVDWRYEPYDARCSGF